MLLPFLDRREERTRLRHALDSETGSLVCLYGRRRCGKTRLIQETLRRSQAVHHLADEREPALQRRALAASIGELLEGFERVDYGDWSSLLERWHGDSPEGAVLALDEFPYLVRTSPELPSVVQGLVDRASSRRVHLILAGSSQRMMQGLLLDASAPLFGRATELIEVRPLAAGWVGRALALSRLDDILEAYSIWGGVPRYWELGASHGSTWEAVEANVLSPLGVLHQEAERLLVDDIRDITQSASILSLIGAGCHRLSEVAARIGKPATSLTRPLERLVDLGLVRRERPFGAPGRGGKKTRYRIEDPFLGFWYRFVEPNRSALLRSPVTTVARKIRRDLEQHTAGVWEELARLAVPHLEIAGVTWQTASRWWGAGCDRRPLEIDVVAESADGDALLVGEAKRSLARRQIEGALAELASKAARLPFAAAYRKVHRRLFVATGSRRHRAVVTGERVLRALR